MSYSCSDFTDDILNALKVEVPEEEYNDNPSAQADLALAEIERLQKLEKMIFEMAAAIGAEHLLPTREEEEESEIVADEQAAVARDAGAERYLATRK